MKDFIRVTKKLAFKRRDQELKQFGVWCVFLCFPASPTSLPGGQRGPAWPLRQFRYTCSPTYKITEGHGTLTILTYRITEGHSTLNKLVHPKIMEAGVLEAIFFIILQ